MMNIPPSNQLRRSHLPEDLIAEVLSWLPVKSLMRFSCVCKSWNTLFISDPTFIKLHRRRSALRRPSFFLHRGGSLDRRRPNFCVAQFSGLRLFENPCPSLVDYPRYGLDKRDRYRVLGSCNGLICLHGSYYFTDEFQDGWLCIWNPATRLISGKLGSFRVNSNTGMMPNLSFGYDSSTDTYKVVKFVTNWSTKTNHVSVFTLGNNVWRDIQNFPSFSFPHCHFISLWNVNEGVHLNGTINWIAAGDVDDGAAITADQYEILSLDLATETSTLLLPPPGVKLVPYDMPSIGVLMDCLCYCHDQEETHFVIWLMKEFGVAESWSQLVKLSYQDLQLDHRIGLFRGLFPSCLSNSDTVILASSIDGRVILYNRRTNTVERTTNSYGEYFWLSAVDYVESLVPLY